VVGAKFDTWMPNGDFLANARDVREARIDLRREVLAAA
jgi:hypothetical protein